MVILGWCVAVRPWKPISWSSRQTVIVLMLLPEAVWNSVLQPRTDEFYAARASALSGPILWACVADHNMAPRCFHFTIIPLTVDLGSTGQIWELTCWHPITVPHRKSQSSSGSPFYWQCLSVEIAWLCARFYTPVSNWSTYFCIYSIASLLLYCWQNLTFTGCWTWCSFRILMVLFWWHYYRCLTAVWQM
jgi:hypothetical protein